MNTEQTGTKKVSQDHFYDREGNLYDGVGLKVARKLLLYPSVTTVGKIMALAPPLRRYQEDQLLRFAYTVRHVHGDTPETWSRRVSMQYGNEVSDAIAYGNVVHAGVEAMLHMKMNEHPDVPPDAAAWISEHLGHDGLIEKGVVEPSIGYGGTADYIGPYYSSKTKRFHETAIVDFKTQGVKSHEKRPRRRDGWDEQLAGYGHAVRLLGIGIVTAWVNVVMNTNEKHPDWTPEEPGHWVYERPKAEMQYALRCLQSTCAHWYLAKKFPAPGTEERRVAENELAEQEFAEILKSNGGAEL